MQIDCRYKESGEFSFTLDKNLEVFEDTLVTLKSEVEVHGTFNKANGNVIVKGVIEFKYSIPCSRCLKELDKDFSKRFQTIFMSDVDAENQVIDDKIELDDVVNEKIVLNLPDRILCSENCKGLCPTCGHDLNKNQCGCNTSIDDTSDEKENPFAVLKDLNTGGVEDGSTKKKNF